MESIRNRIVIVMVVAGLVPAAVVYVLRLVRDELSVEPAVGASYHLLAISLTVLAAAVLAALCARRIDGLLNTALGISRRDTEQAGPLGDAAPREELPETPEAMLDMLHARRLEMETLRDCAEGLEIARAQLHAVWEHVSEALLVVQHDTGEVVSANARFRDMFGFEEDSLRSLPYSSLKSRIAEKFEDPARFEERWSELAAISAEVAEEDWELAVADEDEKVLRMTSTPVTTRDGEVFARLWLFHDLSSERMLRKSLEQAQRLESVGRLAGGVAHDFNNILTGIIGNLALAEAGEGEGDEGGRNLILSAKRAGQRGARLVQQLLGFSRRSSLRVQRVDINDLLRDVHGLMRHSMEGGVRFQTRFAEGVWPVRGDWTQFEQVMLNMCVNARDALGPGGGEIVLSSENVAISEAEAAEDKELEAGEFVKISIRDTGEGIPAKVIGKIFDPFFTTKEEGKGTGLGLSISSEIIRQYGGWLVCESTLGEGTVFEIYLPRDECAEEPDIPEVSGRSEGTGGATAGGSETVLLVDDEELVRSIAEKVLQQRGYRVLCASDGDEAVDVFDREREDIEVVLLDLTMPKVSGKAAFRMLRERRSDLPVILCSGYVVDTAAFEDETGLRPDGALQKPFEPDELLAEVRCVLDEQSGVVLLPE